MLDSMYLFASYLNINHFLPMASIRKKHHTVFERGRKWEWECVCVCVCDEALNNQ